MLYSGSLPMEYAAGMKVGAPGEVLGLLVWGWGVRSAGGEQSLWVGQYGNGA